MNATLESGHPALVIARDMLRRGWNPVPVPVGKSPKQKKWQQLVVTPENVATHFNKPRLNTGIQMGPVSGHLADVDLDCAEALALAKYFLPPTGSTYGRASKRESHRLYICECPEDRGWIKWSDEEKKVMVELRLGGKGKGAQSIAPGSVHPSGEFYEWDKDNGPAHVGYDELRTAVNRLAIASLLMRHWPSKGALHDCALGVGGFLARAGWQANEIEHLVHSICRVLPGVKEAKKHARTAAESVKAFAEGKQVYGLPWMSEFFGKDVADTVAKFVGYYKDDGVEEAKNKEQGTQGVSLSDFYSYMPTHSYIYAPTREMWPAGSVNARVPSVVVGKDEEGKEIKITASFWLDNNRPVEQMTWAPGLDTVIRDRLISEGGWIQRKDVSCFNLYRPPTIALGDPKEAAPWLDLVRRVFRRDGDFAWVVQWFAHRVQRPWEKVNHGLVLGSLQQGVGKDTIMVPIKTAIGPWNFKEVMPGHLFDPFNPYVRSVLLRINEAKDMGEVSRYELYEHMKSYLAAPPDVLCCNEKHLRQHYVLNCMGCVITTNHLTDGIFLPAEDRRHYVAWSDAKPQDFAEGYWVDIYAWLDNGGDRHVAAFLAGVDISHFDPKAPPPKTRAFWDIVNSNRTGEESELQDVLEKLGNPAAVTIAEISAKAPLDLMEWLEDRKNRRAIAHRLESCGYSAVHNPDAQQALWRINDRRQAVYARRGLSIREQIKAARDLRDRKAAEAEEKKRAVEEKRPRAAPAQSRRSGRNRGRHR
jgi:Bifunctional DNA primase/polymerase, N-terminal